MTSSYWILLLLLFPLGGWFYFWRRSEEIVVWEWAAGFGSAILILVVTFWVSAMVAGADKEVYSGHAHQACHTPWWRAEWTEQESYTVTVGSGKDARTETRYRTVTKSRTHSPKWWVETNIGDISVGEDAYSKIAGEFGSYSEKGYRPDFDRGDRYDYFADIKNPPGAPVYPVHLSKTWKNPLKGTDSITLGPEISDEEAAELGLHEYPEVNNPFTSSRVIGAPVDTYEWDQMCALLGPDKKVNVILIYFGSSGLEIAVKQRDYWRNGSKNDLVLCYGDGWSYVFGWSETELVKQELQSLLLDSEVNNELLPEIDRILRADFTRHDWHKYDGTPRPISGWTVVIAFVLMAGSQVGLGFLFHGNQYGK
jgi:hypothetical protein